MQMKTKTRTLWLGRWLHGRTAFSTIALLAAISMMVSGCSSGGGSGSSTPAPTAPVVTSFSASTNSISSGGSTTLSWTVTDSTTITISGVNCVTGASSTVTLGSGTTVSVSPVETTSYTLTATNTVGSTTAKTTITVNGTVVATNCTTAGTLYTAGTGSTIVRVASAANFTSPLLFWLNNYFFSSLSNPNYTADAAAYTMDVCSDSTGNFETAIAAGTYTPNIFFAADTSNVTGSYSIESMEYAQGYPILMGYTSASGKAKTITGITDLVGGLSGTHADVSATIAGGGLASLTFGSLMTTGSPGSLIANPIKAPYGAAAVNIINAVVGANTVTYNTTAITAYPVWMQNPTSYANITTAFNAIGLSTGAPTGFANFSAICTAPPTGAVWVRFTGTDVQTKQSMSNLEVNPGGGTEIYNLIKTEMADTNKTWLKYITADYGFGSCYSGI
jgi:hypothetical protein